MGFEEREGGASHVKMPRKRSSGTVNGTGGNPMEDQAHCVHECQENGRTERDMREEAEDAAPDCLAQGKSYADGLYSNHSGSELTVFACLVFV